MSVGAKRSTTGARKKRSKGSESRPANRALAGAAAKSRRIGSIFRVRRWFRIETFIVIDQTSTHATGVRPDGRVDSRPLNRLGNAILPAPVAVRSHAGRLWYLVHSAQAASHLTDASIGELRRLLDKMLDGSTPRHTVGVLLDRKALGLTDSACLKLPLAHWRVRYELLTGHPRGTVERHEHAKQLLADHRAPLGMRVRVGLAEGLDLGPLGAERAALLGGTQLSTPTLAKVATEIGLALVESGFWQGERLHTAATDPTSFSSSSPTAAALAVVSRRQLTPGRKIDVDGLPTRVIDDLIDAGASIEVSDLAGAEDADGMPDIPLGAYVTARTRPADLTTDEVLKLEFAAEAYRRYIAGDDEVVDALPAARLHDAKVARSLLSGESPQDVPHDPLLATMVDVIRSGGIPSEELLADQSTWSALIANGVRGAEGPGSNAERFADVAALLDAQSALFAWEWSDAQTIARDRLRGARSEAVRDELLNVVACSLWLQDRPEDALAALDKALEGEYTDALLTNAAVIATELEHWSAVDRFVRIAHEAPSSQQRAMAAERALMLWVTDEERVWEDEDAGIPEEILAVLRLLIAEPLPDERYLRILKTLAAHDDDWLAAQPDGAFGPHANRASVRIFRARARGIDEFASELARELKSGQAEKWVEDEREAVVRAAINVLAEQNDEMGAAFFGMTLLQAGIPLEPMQRIPLVCLTVTSITQNIDTDQGEPKDEFIGWMSGAKQAFADLDQEERELVRPLLAVAGDSLGRTYARARAPQIGQAREVYEKISGQLKTIPRSQINHQAVQQVMAPIAEFCRDTWSVLNRVRPLISDRELLQAIDSLMVLASDLGNKVVNVR